MTKDLDVFIESSPENALAIYSALAEFHDVEFSPVYANSQVVMVDEELPVPYISADDLIANKLASRRPQDLADVAAIRQKQKATGKK